eukprot:TRINITY_DN5160_c0_g1_i2.p1 TRINITY_DN5160_c0_g1~~TRINITY_DN5160_c0_g1_i2.p1  ORF type:complete len:302 (+),score=41.53 TRINITY_DN5160_c0_g1_i2:93-998(+)
MTNNSDEAHPDQVAEVDLVEETIADLQRDELQSVVLGEPGWTTKSIQRCAEELYLTKNCQEVYLLEILNDVTVHAICEAVRCNPTIQTLVLDCSTGDVQIGESYNQLFELIGSGSLISLTLHNVFSDNLDYVIPHLSLVLRHSSLRHLSLEKNRINDDYLLPIAKALAGQTTISHINLSNNMISYAGLEMLSEVMSYNRTLIGVALSNILVRIPTDTWEGFTIQEQCKVNREMLELGEYKRESHLRFPITFQRKMRRYWYFYKHLNEKYDIPIHVWESVLQMVDPRGYINQKIRLWMKLQQ